ncbi:His/Gly/Thr/Pro-type tRNA ligase C-terminal domain-containing protein, partial [Bacillus velezensis]|uniref:His/Gly/Thr/Pro-type tRNA ligase C-terminal domain-containing protein n=1 Tax=Bacillus velezensis TaxID=492670 RepID=UPI00203AC78A
VLAGGRYDGLVEALGGPHTPAIGWAAGIERLSMLIDAPQPERPTAVLVPLGAAAESAATRIVAELRRQGIVADMAWRGNMKKRMAKAASSGAGHAIILGDSELESGTAQVKNLVTGEQRSVALDVLHAALTA